MKLLQGWPPSCRCDCPDHPDKQTFSNSQSGMHSSWWSPVSASKLIASLLKYDRSHWKVHSEGLENRLAYCL